MEGDLKNVKKIQISEGVGISGWVEVDEDWKLVSIGNDRLLDFKGGKVRTDKQSRQLLEDFTSRNSGSSVVLVVVDDTLELALALSGKWLNDFPSQILLFIPTVCRLLIN